MEELKAQILDLPTISVKIENVEVNNAVKGDYIPSPETAEIGQTVVVKAVDENGKPTEWEAADFPEGNGDVDWEDIKNKPFGKSEQLTEIATGQINNSSNQNSLGYCSVPLVTNGNRLVLGEKYKVVVTTHSVEEYEFTATGSSMSRLLGTGGEGQVYVYDLAPMGGMTAYVKPFGDSACNVSVYHITGELKTLPVEYLPEIPVEKLPEDIGENIEWIDIENNPFGSIAIEWKKYGGTTYNGMLPSVQGFTATFDFDFLPEIGKLYKVVIIDKATGTERQFTGVGNSKEDSYVIGVGGGGDYAWVNANSLKNLHINLQEPILATSGVYVDIYKDIWQGDPIPVRYLPETVVMESELEAKGYQTAEQVNALINEALGVVENGYY